MITVDGQVYAVEIIDTAGQVSGTAGGATAERRGR